MAQRPVKIVATLGPASSHPATVERLLAGGVDVARLNFSHGTFQDHAARIDLVRRLADVLERPVAVLQDLPGPKARVAELPGGRVELEPGSEVTLGPASSHATLPLDLEEPAAFLRAGDRVLLADGAVDLEVLGAKGGLVRCRVLTGGAVSSRKGVTLPSRRWRPAVPTPADLEALAFGVARGVDLLALSFVGSAAEVRAAREAVLARGGDQPVIAKIETRRALDNLEEIVAEADGVMVARGDLGVEMPPEDVPPAQRRIIALARRHGKPAIVATQMLGSMVSSPRPTRAETADVAAAVWGGADAVMLSDETAAGAHPVESVAVMSRIIAAAAREDAYPGPEPPVRGPADAVARAACRLAADVDAVAIVAATSSGFTAAAVSRFRPACPVIGLTTDPATARRLCLYRGVTPRLEEPYDDLDDMGAKAAGAARALGLAEPGSLLVCTAGLPFAARGGTDLVRVVRA